MRWLAFEITRRVIAFILMEANFAASFAQAECNCGARRVAALIVGNEMQQQLCRRSMLVALANDLKREDARANIELSMRGTHAADTSFTLAAQGEQLIQHLCTSFFHALRCVTANID